MPTRCDIFYVLVCTCSMYALTHTNVCTCIHTSMLAYSDLYENYCVNTLTQYSQSENVVHENVVRENVVRVLLRELPKSAALSLAFPQTPTLTKLQRPWLRSVACARSLLSSRTQTHTHTIQPPPSEDAAQQQTQQILKFLPLMIGYFALNVPAGLGIYWVCLCVSVCTYIYVYTDIYMYMY